MTLLEQIDDLIDKTVDEVGQEDATLTTARLAVRCAQAIKLVAGALDELSDHVDQLDLARHANDRIDLAAEVAALRDQLDDMAKSLKKLSKKSKKKHKK